MTVWPPAQMLYYWATGDYVEHAKQWSESNGLTPLWLGSANFIVSNQETSSLRLHKINAESLPVGVNTKKSVNLSTSLQNEQGNDVRISVT